MTGTRRLLLDESAGERRAVVLLDGRPERLWIERDGEPAALEVGNRAVARVRRLERAAGLAFLDLGGAEAVLSLSGAAAGAAAGAVEGEGLEIEITAPARFGKAAVARRLGAGVGEPRLLDRSRDLIERLRSVAPDRQVERGSDAREAADLAEEAVLAHEYPLTGGGSLAIETTRGLTAIDVDLGAAAGADSRRGASRANQLAVATAARLLRLNGLGGLVVFDLAGRGQDGEAVTQAAKAAFAPDAPGVAFGPVSRLGVFHLALPWRRRPVREQLLDERGLPSARTVAQRLGRSVEREAARAVRVKALCAPEVAAASAAVRAGLVARLGPRLDIQPDPSRDREDFVVVSL